MANKNFISANTSNNILFKVFKTIESLTIYDVIYCGYIFGAQQIKIKPSNRLFDWYGKMVTITHDLA